MYSSMALALCLSSFMLILSSRSCFALPLPVLEFSAPLPMPSPPFVWPWGDEELSLLFLRLGDGTSFAAVEVSRVYWFFPRFTARTGFFFVGFNVATRLGVSG